MIKPSIRQSDERARELDEAAARKKRRAATLERAIQKLIQEIRAENAEIQQLLRGPFA